MKHRLNNRRKFVIAILTMGALASACSDPTIIGSSADTIDDQEFSDSDQSDESTTSESTPIVLADEIVWTKCKADPQGESQCGELAVPFDYQDPSLGSFTLFLTRRPAGDQKFKVGSMLVNPGGPGFGGSSVAADAEYYFSDELLDRFDIIGWDPRGTGKSTPAVNCVDEYDDYFGIDSTPESPEEKQAIIDAVEGSLKRLQTDYIDLYQLHWPERGVNCFGLRDYPFKTATKDAENHLEILETLDDLIKQGKIKHIGLSNETPWGAMKYLQTSEQHNLPRMLTVQNSYSLIHRAYEVGMSEVSLRENLGLLVYSPLAQGVLTGKYLKGKSPEGARGTLFPNYITRYQTGASEAAVLKYLDIANRHQMTLTELSLAFVNQLPFVTSNIIGATKMEQLKENIKSINVTLSDEVLYQINAVHAVIPNPAP